MEDVTRGRAGLPGGVLLVGVRLQRPQKRRQQAISGHCGRRYALSGDQCCYPHCAEALVAAVGMEVRVDHRSRGIRVKLGSRQPYVRLYCVHQPSQLLRFAFSTNVNVAPHQLSRPEEPSFSRAHQSVLRATMLPK